MQARWQKIIRSLFGTTVIVDWDAPSISDLLRDGDLAEELG